MPTLPRTGLDVHPLCPGGNVFGWTADDAASFAVLDAYAATGGNVATKVSGRMPGEDGLTADIVRRACDNGLQRLRTDRRGARPRLRAWRSTRRARAAPRAVAGRGVARVIRRHADADA